MGSLFIIGLVFSFLSHLADIIKDNPYGDMSKLRLFFLMFTRSIFGGIVAVTIFYGLLYYFPDMTSELRVGLSSAGAFMSEQVSLLVLTFINSKVKNE
jgi:uncharacterized membrane protein